MALGKAKRGGGKGLRYNTAIRVVPDPRGLQKFTDTELAGAMIEIAQEIIFNTGRKPPIGTPVLTGHNRRSHGWAFAKQGARSFGMLDTMGLGKQSSSGVDSEPGQMEVIVATTSGYGGVLAVKTGYMDRALEDVRAKAQRILRAL